MNKKLSKILIIFTFLITANNINAEQYNWNATFETDSAGLDTWVKSTNATFTVNEISLSTEHANEGSKSLKFDITFHGDSVVDNGSCYYYWKFPILPNVNIHDSLVFSGSVYLDSTFENSGLTLAFGYDFQHRPSAHSGLASTLITGDANQWLNYENINISTLGNNSRASIVSTYIAGATAENLGTEVDILGLLIKGKGEHRVVFYVDNISLSGDKMIDGEFDAMVDSTWAIFKTRLDSIILDRHATHNALPAMPDTSSYNLSAIGKIRYALLEEYTVEINRILTEMDEIILMSRFYFKTEKLDSLDYFLEEYPKIHSFVLNEIANSNSKVVLRKFNAMKYQPLDGIRLDDYEEHTGFSKRMCAGEFEPMAFIIEPQGIDEAIHASWTPLVSSSNTISKTALDVSIAKIWFQAGYSITNKQSGMFLKQELLLKDDSLVLVNFTDSTNKLRVINNLGVTEYIDISSPTARFPEDATVLDSDTLMPFVLDSLRYKLMWIKLHIPEDAVAGSYKSYFYLISKSGDTLAEFPINIEVLPFELDSSRLTYSIYYHGRLPTDSVVINKYFYGPLPTDTSLATQYSAFYKTPEQVEIELKDMKDHGILYPTTYQWYSRLDEVLTIRNSLDFPKDRLYSLGIAAGVSSDSTVLVAKKIELNKYKAKMAEYGYSNLHVYGQDERSGDELLAQRLAWQAVHEVDVKIFVACYTDAIDIVGDMLDIAVFAKYLDTVQARRYHEYGNKIFSYANPQVGVENPEVYRRNFGLALWDAGYDGAMDYAYQKNYGSFWNDFDTGYSASTNNPYTYREETFTYPTSNGILETVQWEGFREGIDDVRYLSTLLNMVDSLKALGENMSAIEAWIETIDVDADLDASRNGIVDQILALKGPSSINNNDFNSKKIIKVFPNPFNPTLNISYNSKVNNKIQFSIYNMSGRLVYSIESKTSSISWNAGKFASGSYMVKIRDGAKVFSKKAVLLK